MNAPNLNKTINNIEDNTIESDILTIPKRLSILPSIKETTAINNNITPRKTKLYFLNKIQNLKCVYEFSKNELFRKVGTNIDLADAFFSTVHSLMLSKKTYMVHE